MGDLNYTFTGKILANGGIPVTRGAFELSDDMLFQNSTLDPATMLEGGSNFSVGLILEGGKLHYYRTGANQRGRFDRHVAQEAEHPTNGRPVVGAGKRTGRRLANFSLVRVLSGLMRAAGSIILNQAGPIPTQTGQVDFGFGWKIKADSGRGKVRILTFRSTRRVNCSTC